MSKKSLIDQAIELQIPMKFSNYYKFSFSFIGAQGNFKVSASIGGNSEDIYGLELSSDTTIPLSKDRFNFITIEDMVSGEKESWDDY